KEQQEMLNLQIAKLEDDEYLAKLARKEYFLSEEGEIIFTIPKDKEE
ncbi:septum formation initiator, partial [Butyricicoccus sp. 1XD8-22]